MCQCNAEVKIPYCGKPPCEWPKRPTPAEITINTEEVLKTPNLMETIADHLTAGGDLSGLCDMWHIGYGRLVGWIEEEPARSKKFKVAKLAQSDLLQSQIIKEAKKVAFADIREAYGPNGELLEVCDMPDGIAAAIVSVDVFERTGDLEYRGRTKKLKLQNKLEALKLLSDFMGMTRTVHQIEAGSSLEELIAGSFASDEEKKDA